MLTKEDIRYISDTLQEALERAIDRSNFEECEYIKDLLNRLDMMEDTA